MRTTTLSAALPSTVARVALATLVLGTFVPGTALAKDKPAGSIEVADVVEVPLYAGLDPADPAWFVQLDVGDKPLLLRVATGHSELRVTEAAAKRVGLKVTGGEGKKKAKLAEGKLGAATIVDATVTIATPGPEVPFDDYDGWIGLPGFPDAAWAVLPSEGKLKIAPAAKGAELLSGFGTPVDYAVSETRKVKVGTEKEELKGGAIVAPVAFSGAETRASLKTEFVNTWLVREAEGQDLYTVKGAEPRDPMKLPAAPAWKAGERTMETRDVGLGGQTVTTTLDRRGQGPVSAYALWASVGQDVLGNFDLALDTANKKLALRPVTESKLADWAPTKEKALRDALTPKAAEGAEAPDAKAVEDAKKGGLGPLADFLASRGRLDEAVEARRELATLDAQSCTAWLGLGETLLEAGRPADAVEPLSKAAELYLPWSQLPLAERKAIAEDKAKAEKKGGAWEGSNPQDHACHVAPGLLAQAKVAQKDAAAVAALYPARLDLDPGLPLAAGTAALQKGDLEAAQAAFRQAIKLTIGEEAEEARAGLFLALREKDLGLALQQLERTRFRAEDGTDPQLVRLYVAALQATAGAPATVKALEDVLASDPGDVVLLTELGRVKAASGDAAGAEKAFAAATARLATLTARTPADPRLWALKAQLLAASGKVDDARAAAEKATKAAPGSGLAWLALADVETAAGNAAAAAEHLKRAGAVDVGNPAYAQLVP